MLNNISKKSIVVSGVSIDSGGPLTIFKDILSFLSSSEWGSQYEIIAIVHDEKLFDIDNVKYISIPKADNWLLRLYYEYCGFNKISQNLNSFLWLSLQVATPRVKTERQALYMHNPSPFYKWRLKDLSEGARYILFAIFFKYIYRINLKSNNYLIVQQSWLRNAFSTMYSFSKKKIVVAYPPRPSEKNVTDIESKRPNQIYTFFFPALPRIFKNFEIVCEAVKILNSEGVNNFQVIQTIDGSENKYSRNIVNKYSGLKELKFIGLVPHKDIDTYYEESDCLIFPSKLETWGLPISEFSKYKKPMIIADLPYAHETASGCDLVTFFDVDNASELALKMKRVKDGDYTFLQSVPVMGVEEPVVSSWKKIFDILLK
ncbi:MAG: glycosyltransferase [Dysgonomonas sp.]|uniref:glycosyltransferase n=1 Tax=Dysgonomonas sp. TaxID=1891233 RepID=UPI00257AB32C|nr:glycosyltransferase [Dysgonomonas sp.]MBS7121092.1 glycosyltransferase [Dysgonomonas sp.]